MDVLKNYKPTGDRVAEFVRVDVRYSDTDVFTSLPLCIVPFGSEFKEAYLVDVDPRTNIGRVVGRDDVDSILANTRIYHLGYLDDKGENSRLREVLPKEAVVSVRLPLDTDVSTLVIHDGQVYKLDDIEEVPEGDASAGEVVVEDVVEE